MPKTKKKKAARQVTYMPLDEIEGAPLNPKRHHGDIGASIGRFGFADAPIMDERTQRLVAGHGRVEQLLAMLERGESPPDGIDTAGGRWLVPVQRGWSSRSDEEAAAFLVAHNRIGEAGGWDDTELAQLLDALGEDARTDLGIEADELAQLLESLSDAEPGDDPGAGEPPAEPASERGEVYALGPHRLMCGDSTSAEDVAALLGGEEPRLMVTDPPYGVGLAQGWRDEIGANRLAPAQRDELVGDDRANWFDAWDVSPSDVAYCWAPPGAQQCDHAVALESSGYLIRQQLIWVKSVFVIGRSAWHWSHEPCWYAVRKGKSAGWLGARDQTTVIEAASPKHIMGGSDEAKQDHPSQKPLECMERPIRNHEGDVYDPFLGSGTTLIAAARQGRRCYGLEISPAYCDVIRRRWGDYARGAGIEPGPDAL